MKLTIDVTAARFALTVEREAKPDPALAAKVEWAPSVDVKGSASLALASPPAPRRGRPGVRMGFQPAEEA